MQENETLYNSLAEDVSDYTLANLIKFIQEDFHNYFTENLSLISNLMHSCVIVDATEISNLPAINKIFLEFKNSLEQHKGEEEFILFPVVRDLLKHKNIDSISPAIVFKVIDSIENKHIQLVEKLNALEKETNFFEEHTNASPTLKQVYSLLIKLKHNYMVYSFIENNYLYPKLNHLIKQLN